MITNTWELRHLLSRWYSRFNIEPQCEGRKWRHKSWQQSRFLPALDTRTLESKIDTTPSFGGIWFEGHVVNNIWQWKPMTSRRLSRFWITKLTKYQLEWERHWFPALRVRGVIPSMMMPNCQALCVAISTSDLLCPWLRVLKFMFRCDVNSLRNLLHCPSSNNLITYTPVNRFWTKRKAASWNASFKGLHAFSAQSADPSNHQKSIL